MSIDFTRIADAARAQAEGLIMELFPHARRDGAELRVGSINGEEGKSLSINISSTAWKDFATGDCGGDLISLYAAKFGIKQSEAAAKLDDRLSLGAITAKAGHPVRRTAAYKASDWIAQPFCPDECICLAPTSKRIFRDDEWRDYPVAASWEYRDASNRLVGYVCRVNYPDGSKDVFPYTFCVHKSKREEWRYQAFAKPRPLYRLPELIKSIKPPVLVVEGEKTADAAKRLLPGLAVTTWPGGSQAIRLADFSHLTGRIVMLWPDADDAGRSAMTELRLKLLPKSKQVLIILPPDDWKDGYDLADAERDGWDSARVLAHISLRKQEFVPAEEPLPNEPQPTFEDAIEQPATQPDAEWPFQCVGYNHGVYYYMPAGGDQVVSLTAAAHSKNDLLQLAPMDWWETMFACKTGVAWAQATNTLFRRQYQVGIFEPNRLRGRGAWIDEQAVVLHTGDKLIVNGQHTTIADHPTRFIYEKGQTMRYDLDNPATAAEASKLIDLCQSLPLKTRLDATLLAGWVTVAPICGALSWRPHLWISGSKGTGKTWVVTNIISPMLGDNILKVQSSSTEAGIRQKLHLDALPVVFDEAESEDQRGQARMKSVIELARQASSETGAGICKGTPSGEAIEYSIRSSFLFSSIGVASMQAADLSRITPIELYRRPIDIAADAFRDLKAHWAEVIGNNGFAGHVRARTLSLAMVIRENASIFAKAISLKLGDQRMGDQLGALCAGAFSLTSSRPVTIETATAWVDKQPWDEFRPSVTDADEHQAFNTLFASQVRMETKRGSTVTSLGDLVQTSVSVTADQSDIETASKTLLLYGVKIVDQSVAVANTHPALKQIFSNTAWAGKWRDQLKRMEGAKPALNPLRFVTVVDRAVLIPIEHFVG